MGIKKKISVYKGDLSSTPSLQNVMSPAIYMGESTYSKDCQRIIFRHELNHFLHRDLVMQAVILFLSVIYWWHPLFFRGIYQEAFRRWCEDYCDCAVCEKESMDEYICVLLKIAIEGIEMGHSRILAVAESKNDVKRRIAKMEKYKTAKRMKKSIAVICAGVCLLGGSLAAYAAGDSLASGYEKVYSITDEAQYHSVEQDDMVEYTEEPGWEEGLEIYEEAGVARSTGSIDWSVKYNSQKQTSGFYMSSGSTIFVAVSIDPTNKSVDVGIIRPNGSKLYVSGSGDISHTFPVETSGTYKVFIKNGNSVTVEAMGYYRN